MKAERFNDESIIKALPIIAPLTNTSPAINAFLNGRYSEVAFGTALGVAIGIAGRVLILKDIASNKSVENSEVILLQDMDKPIDSEGLQYEAQG